MSIVPRQILITILYILITETHTNCEQQNYFLLQQSKLANGQKIFEYALRNGLGVVLVKDALEPIISYRTSYSIGSVHEPPGQQGLSHFVEHLLREMQTKNGEDISRLVKLRGGRNFNAATSRDGTSFYVTLPKYQLEFIAMAESAYMENLIIDPGVFAKEKKAIFNEKISRNIYNYLWDDIYSFIFQKHNYRYDIIGDNKVIEDFTLEDAIAFHKSYFKPNNALIVVVGDINPEEAIEIIAEKYSHIEPGETPEEYVIYEPEPSEDLSIHLHHEKARLYTFVKIWRTSEIHNTEIVPFRLLGYLMEFCLKGEINETSVVKVAVNPIEHRYDHLFVFWVESVDPIVPEYLHQVFDSCLGFFENSLNENILNIAKEDYRQKLYNTFTRQNKLAQSIGGNYLKYQNPLFDSDILQQVEKTDAENIKLLIKKRCRQPAYTILFSPQFQE